MNLKQKKKEFFDTLNEDEEKKFFGELVNEEMQKNLRGFYYIIKIL